MTAQASNHDSAPAAQSSRQSDDDFRCGLRHHQHGDLGLAQRSYNKVLRRHPRDPEVLRLLATVELQRNQLDAAERHARHAVASNPHLAGVHNTLGQILAKRERFDEALEAFDAALRIDAGHANARANRGRTLLRLHRVDEGVADMAAALHSEPQDAALASEIAMVMKAAGRTDEAEAYFRMALAQAPHAAASCINLGAFYMERQDLAQAVQFLSKAVEIDSSNAGAWMNLAMTLKMQGHLAEALECLRTVLALQPGNADAAALAASVLHGMGEYAESRRLYEEVLAVAPLHPTATPGLAELLEWSGEYDAAVECMAPIMAQPRATAGHAVTYARVLRRVRRQSEAVELLERFLPDTSDSTPSMQHAKQIHFTLAHLCDDLGRYEQAWQHYRKANDAHWASFDSAAHSRLVDSVIAEYSADRRDRLASSECDDARPLFVLGMPRSGTSLVEQILAAHPNVRALGETGYISALISSSYPSDVARLRVDDLNRLANSFFAKSGPSSSQYTRITEKTPQNFLYLGLIERLFPKARIVHCCRDPLDTMLSCYFTEFRGVSLSYSFDLDALARYYQDYRRLMAHWRSTLALPMLDLSYETLVGDQQAATQALLAFAGLDWDDRCLEYYRSERTIHTASHAQVREPIYSRSVGRWRHYAAFLGPLLKAAESV